MMPTYTSREQEVIAYLSTLTTDTKKLPREWKQFLTYHRLAWNILSHCEPVQKIPGWQVQLLVWIFCCWQWKDRINDIIKKWKDLVVVNGVSMSDDDFSLKNIVEQYVDEMLLPYHMNDDINIQEEKKMEEKEAKKKKEEQEIKMELEDTKKNQEEEWGNLIETLVKYDVSRESIEFFQKFRLDCEVGHLH